MVAKIKRNDYGDCFYSEDAVIDLIYQNPDIDISKLRIKYLNISIWSKVNICMQIFDIRRTIFECLNIFEQGSSKNTNFLYELAPKLFPFIFGILTTMKNFKVLAGREVLPPDPHFRAQKYKGSIKAKYSKHVFQFLNVKRILQPKSDPRVVLLWFRRFFRHQYRPVQLMSYIDVICAYDIK